MDETENEILAKVAQITIPPGIAEMLKSYQIQHVKILTYALKRRGIAIDLSDTGTGKTFSAIAVCKLLDLRPLIITPKATIPNWYKVAETFSVEPLGVINYETAKNSKYYSSLDEFYADVRVECPYIEVVREIVPNVFTSAGLPKKRIVEIKWKLDPGSVIIFDEVQRGKNGIAQKAIMGSGEATGTSKLVVSTAPYLDRRKGVFGMFLSATLTDRINCFDVICYVLGLYRPYNKKAYLHYIGRISNDPATVMQFLHKKIIPKYGSRMAIDVIKEETGDEIFKECDVQAKAYNIDPKIAAEIELQHQIIHQAMVDLRIKSEHAINPLVIMLRARQKIEMLKVQLFAELITKNLHKNKYVVIFINFKETKKILTEKVLEMSDGTITLDDIDYIDGTNSPADRERIRTEFQEDRIMLLICQMRAGGVGISLHDIIGDHPRVGLHSPTWSAIEMKQAIGRLYRADAKSHTKQRIVYSKPRTITIPTQSDNPIEQATTTEQAEQAEQVEPTMDNGATTYTIEESVCKNVNEKLRNISVLNDGDLHGHQDLV
jgi:hypothetical protein